MKGPSPLARRTPLWATRGSGMLAKTSGAYGLETSLLLSPCSLRGTKVLLVSCHFVCVCVCEYVFLPPLTWLGHGMLLAS